MQCWSEAADIPEGRMGIFQLLAWLLAGSSQPALPSTANPPQAEEIVITGRRLPSPDLVRSYVRNSATPVGGQIAVFRTPICPNVFGVDSYDAAKLVERMRLVAKSAGILMSK